MPRTRKSEKKSTKPARKPDPQRAERMRVLRRRLAHGAGVVAVLTIIGVGYKLSWDRVRQASLPQQPPALVLVDFPDWLGDQGELLVRGAVGEVPATSPLESDALRVVRSRLEAEPWVRSVTSVRRRSTVDGDVIEAVCEYRAPVAVVEHGGFFWMVDRAGVLLPKKLGVDQLRRQVIGDDGETRMRRIENIQLDPPHPGQLWGGEDLQAALRMEALLRGEPWAGQIAAIDMANYGGRRDVVGPHVTLRTKDGNALGWGRPPGEEDPLLEIATDAKAARLRHLLAQFGRIDLNASRTDHRDERILVYPEGNESEAKLAGYADIME
ncbi:MAG: hypothetical protein AAF743_05095 [Planctomycetota bacterium]